LCFQWPTSLNKLFSFGTKSFFFPPMLVQINCIKLISALNLCHQWHFQPMVIKRVVQVSWNFFVPSYSFFLLRFFFVWWL
jgi:hypothetical protein